jgi:hypothetical protein
MMKYDFSQAATIIAKALAAGDAASDKDTTHLVEGLYSVCWSQKLPVEYGRNAAGHPWICARIDCASVLLTKSGPELILVVSWAGQNKLVPLSLPRKPGADGKDAAVVLAEAFATEVKTLIESTTSMRRDMEARGIS